MTLPQAPLQVQMTYEDRPEISESYADLLGRVGNVPQAVEIGRAALPALSP